ncbi:MAG: hypothetical protein CL879_10240, partial [Dehalococcoidia bacterium]|nr:hypothetical protein [Dehalococcoidia bacterium]
MLAAGLGSRLQSFTRDRPKPLVEINGVPLIDYSLEPLINIEEIDEIIIVIENMGGRQIADHVNRQYRSHGERIRLVHNDQCHKESVVTPSKALPWVDT